MLGIHAVTVLGYGREVAAAGRESDASKCSACHPSRSD